MKDSNRSFQLMFQAAKEMLAGKDPAEVSASAGVTFDGKAFLVPSMGKLLSFSYPEYICTELLHDWHYLVILHYLNMADGFPVSWEPTSLSEMPDGVIRGTKYDRTLSQALSVFLSGKSEVQVKQILEKLGAEFLAGKADLNARLPFLPRFPLYMNIWFADEEFPPSARLLVDRSAGHYLTVEDAVTLGDVVLELMKKAVS